MSKSLRKILLSLQARDSALLAQLQAEGVLFDGYHPLLEVLHRENAERLCELIEQFGWPIESLAGSDGAEAAWLVAQHAISDPVFMRKCRTIVEKEASLGHVPMWHFAYLDDRIRAFEGIPQRFGTQFDIAPGGPKLCEVDEPTSLGARRKKLGLPSVAARLKSLKVTPRPTPLEFAARKDAEAKWRVKVGWCIAEDALK